MTLHNPFPVPSPLDKILLAELVQVAQECYNRGWSWGTAGNFSLRGSNGVVWQSPTGVCKGDLRAELFVPVDLETEKEMQFSIHRASAEMPVHAGIYKFVADAKCVVHTHPPALVGLSRNRKKLTFSGEEMGKALGLKSHTEALTIPVLPNATPEEMLSYSGRIKSGLGDTAKVVVLEGHGVWAWGRTPKEALGFIEALDILCQQTR
jgi:ribulose-5-phosphate 4-epimerase/fuculose-1-phosphate aldolase